MSITPSPQRWSQPTYSFSANSWRSITVPLFSLQIFLPYALLCRSSKRSSSVNLIINFSSSLMLSNKVVSLNAELYFFSSNRPNGDYPWCAKNCSYFSIVSASKNAFNVCNSDECCSSICFKLTSWIVNKSEYNSLSIVRNWILLFSVVCLNGASVKTKVTITLCKFSYLPRSTIWSAISRQA